MTSQNTSAAEAARPRAISDRGQRRRAAILAAATREFLEKGFDGASMRAIIRAAGGSADAVYRMFGAKSELFQAVMTDLIQRHYQRFLRPENLQRPIFEELHEFGLSYVETVMGDEALRFYRMMIGGGGAMPEAARIFWESGAGSVAVRLESYLRAQHERGIVDIAEPALAATQFLELAKGGMHIKLLCTGERPAREDVEKRVRAAASLFVKAYGRNLPAAAPPPRA